MSGTDTLPLPAARRAPELETDLQAIAADLAADLASRGSVLVAFSGGVDSGVVAALAHRALGAAAVAVTAAAETLAGAELDQARRVAAEIGIRHEVMTYSELDDPEFVAQPVATAATSARGCGWTPCYGWPPRWGFAVVCDGTNASDPGPDRPGLRAVQRARGLLAAPRPRRRQGGDPRARPRARPVGVGPAGQRLPVVAHPARPAGHPRQAAPHRGRRGGPRRPRLPGGAGAARPGATPASRSAPTRSPASPPSGARSSRACSPSASRRAAFDPRGYRRGGADARPEPSPPAEGPSAALEPRSARDLLEAVAAGGGSPEQALGDLAELPYADLGFAKLDLHRELRNGLPEAVYAEGKRTEDLLAIVDRLLAAHGRVLVTRLRPSRGGGPARRPSGGDLPRAGADPHLRRAAPAADARRGHGRRARRRHLGPAGGRGGGGLRRLVRARGRAALRRRRRRAPPPARPPRRASAGPRW